MHYEIEQAGAGDEHRPDVGSHVKPERWHVADVFNADAVPMPLRFDTLDQALAYTYRTPGTLRIVEVTDFGERVPVEAGRREAGRAGPLALRGRAAPARSGRRAGAARRSGRYGLERSLMARLLE